MGQTEATRQSDWILPPTADSSGNPAVVAIAVTTAVAAIDLNSMTGIPVTYGAGLGGGIAGQALDPSPLGHYIDIEAQGGDVYFLFGPTFASVTGANAPLNTTTNTLSGSGVVTMAKQVCGYLPAGTTKSFKLPIGAQNVSGSPGVNSQVRFLAAVTASGATATLRIWQSSP